MDIGDIDKIINRKSILEFSDKVQEVVAKENNEIIKLRVAQDAESRGEKEKLSQLKVENERLQYKIQELQRQNEEVSMMYLNKLDDTRKLCDELQRLAQQCAEARDRDEAERARLQARCDAAGRSAQRLSAERAAELQHAPSGNNALLEKPQGVVMTPMTSPLDPRLGLSSQLEAATSDRNELAAATEDAKKKLEKANSELDKRDATITNLQHEMRNMASNFHSQLVEAKNILMKKDNDLKSAAEEIESLKKALSSQEQFAKTQCDGGHELLEKLALAENQQRLAAASNEEYKKKLEEMTSTCEHFKNNIEMLKDENDALTKELESNEETINLYNTELDSHQQLLLQYQSELEETTSKLNKTIEECENKDKLIEKLKADNETHIKTLSESEVAFQNSREEAQEKLKSMAETIKEKCFEIEMHTCTIRQANAELLAEKEERAKLTEELRNVTASLEERDHELEVKTSALIEEKEERANLTEELRNVTASLEERDHELEVKTSALIEEKEARAKIETDFVKLKRDFEIQTETLREQTKKVSQLEAGMRAKEEEHSREMADFFKVRAEMDREKNALRDIVISGLEKKIVNIMTLASKTNVERPRLRPEPDEDAVDEYRLSARSEADRGQGVEAQQDAVMILARFDSFNDSVFNNFSESSWDSLRLRPQRPPAVAAETRPRSERPPTPAPTRARDAHHTALQPQSQADQWFEQLRGEEPTTTPAPKRARPDAPATAVTGDAATAVSGDAATYDDPPAADAIPTVSRTTTKERRFFKTLRNSSTAKDNEKKTKKKK